MGSARDRDTAGELEQLKVLIEGELEAVVYAEQESLVKAYALLTGTTAQFQPNSQDQTTYQLQVIPTDDSFGLQGLKGQALYEKLSLIRFGLNRQGATIPDPRPWALRPFTPTISDRVKAWEGLTARIAAYSGKPMPDDEVEEIQREYEYYRALNKGMMVEIVVYQLLVMAALAVCWWRLSLLWKPTTGAMPYITCGFWGMLGASTASLWSLEVQAAERRIRMDTVAGHLLRPIVGAFLGVLVSLLTAGNLLKQDGSGPMFASALAALAGLQEATFMRKLKELTVAVLGAGTTGSKPSAKSSS